MSDNPTRRDNSTTSDNAAPRSGPLLQVDGLRISFDQYERGLRRRTITVVSGMDLRVDSGELVAMVGGSGAGKSLLAHAVLGLLPPNARESGTIAFDGILVPPGRPRRAAARHMALMPQAVTYLDPLAQVGRQVRRSAHLAGLPDPARAARAALHRHGLGEEVLARYPHELSGGMLRRVLFTMATMRTPRLVFADEPTPGLPAESARLVLRELRDLADTGVGVVLITHGLRGALDVADRVVVVQDGRTVDDLRPTAFTGSADDVTGYARALWRALPSNDFDPCGVA